MLSKINDVDRKVNKCIQANEDKQPPKMVATDATIAAIGKKVAHFLAMFPQHIYGHGYKKSETENGKTRVLTAVNNRDESEKHWPHFKNNVAELRITLLKSVSGVDARYAGANDDYVVVDGVALCGHDGGEVDNAGGQEGLREDAQGNLSKLRNWPGLKSVEWRIQRR